MSNSSAFVDFGGGFPDLLYVRSAGFCTRQFRVLRQRQPHPPSTLLTSLSAAPHLQPRARHPPVDAHQRVFFSAAGRAGTIHGGREPSQPASFRGRRAHRARPQRGLLVGGSHRSLVAAACHAALPRALDAACIKGPPFRAPQPRLCCVRRAVRRAAARPPAPLGPLGVHGVRGGRNLEGGATKEGGSESAAWRAAARR